MMKAPGIDVVKIRDKKVTTVIWFLIVFLACHLLAGDAESSEDIQSRAAVVMDAATGRVLYAKNPELRLMPASTTKLMTALVVIEKANLKDVVTVSRNATNTAPTRSGLRPGDRVTIETLLYAALMKSANDAAVALAEAVAGSEEEFVQLMNRKALAIGANDTHYINANGLPGKGQYITAYDLSKIMRHAIKYPVLKEILGTKMTEISTQTGKTLFIKNTNKLLWSDEDVLGGKTGYTNQARHCFVCAGEKDKDTLVVALLGSPRRELLWRETEELMGFGSRVLNNTEEPVVYLTRVDYDAARITKAAYTKKTAARAGKKKYKSTKKKKHIVTAGKKVTKKKHIVTAKKKVTKKRQLASSKKKKRIIAKNKKAKKTDVAKKGNDDTKG
ncbi:MAG: D-alanyl-D-alanine carboxypeptidase [Nitrospiraceae bacterium]|nr:MAG: D-alanyl-D-alanine carboxypeptidase [Nitrospiraceae bacterium]